MKNLELSGRKPAEIISFLLSSGTILGLLIYLGVSHLNRKETKYLNLKAEILKDKIKEVGDHYVIPIRIHNLGDKTPTTARFRIDVVESGEKSSHRIDVEYLSRLSSKTVFWVNEKNLSEADVTVTSESYQF